MFQSMSVVRVFLSLVILLTIFSCRKDSKPKPSKSADLEPPAASSVVLAAADTALPGAEPHPKEQYDLMLAAVAARGSDYQPRTRHKHPDGRAKYVNRLTFETSPYLWQHAHNPVNWHAWGDEAFALANKLDRPVFLSIGYSTCHWCHVMEEESFEDPEIAAYLNQHFVAIKVDREERPDVDSIYMTAVQLMTGRGGWPMSMWLTFDRKPFYGGTYFPPRTGARGRRTGFLEILQRIHRGWTDDRSQVMDSARELSASLRMRMRPGVAGVSVNAAAALHKAADGYRAGFDSTWGGLRGRPGDTKFPSSYPVRFLLRYARRTGDDKLREMALVTLRKMAAGGMYDQVGGGFHRYSTDQKWLVPHFEKMLYDNALLVPAYLDGYQASGDVALADVARDVLRYVGREMTSPEGGFYSATDADSLTPKGHREEGTFFVWTPAELDALLGARAGFAKAYWAVSEAGNFEGKNILWAPRPLAEVAAEHKLSLTEARRRIEDSKPILYRERAKRRPPLRDDKILAAWNGMMISAFARAAIVLGPNRDGGPPYVDQGVRAAELIVGKMLDGGRLLRTYHQGRARLNAYVTDYAFVIAAFLDLFEATGDSKWLDHARALDKQLAKGYEDPTGGAFFMTSSDHEKLLVREKPNRDGALPSGNSVAAMNLVRLYELTSDEAYRERVERLFSAFADIWEKNPGSLSVMLSALDAYTDAVKQIVIVTPHSREQAAPLLAELRKRYVPSQVLVVVPEAQVPRLAKQLSLVSQKRALRGVATAYVCEQQRCELPTSDPRVFGRQLEKVEPLPK